MIWGISYVALGSPTDKNVDSVPIGYESLRSTISGMVATVSLDPKKPLFLCVKRKSPCGLTDEASQVRDGNGPSLSPSDFPHPGGAITPKSPKYRG